MKETIDYSKKENWFQIPEITKDVDTFYIYATEYIMGSLMEGAPEYASLDNEEMLQGAAGEYLLHATAYADATNVFMPYYRQCGMVVMKRAWMAATVRITRSSTTTSRTTWPNVSQPIRRM